MIKKLFAVMSVCFPLVILWARTGLVPAASAGDEVWWSESGYHFLREGVLRWACLNDDKGSAILSFWPPVAPLLQAFLMWTFGINAFGICAQSSLVSTFMMVGVFLLCRKLGIGRTPALFASAAIFGLLIVDRLLTTERMDNLTALSALFYAVLIISCTERKDPRGKFILGILAGLILGIGLFSYYPLSPFLLLACFAALFSVGESATWIAFSIVIGSLPVLAAAAFWIGPHWTLFERQVLNVGARDYLSPWNAVAAFSKMLNFSPGIEWAETLETLSVLLLSIAGMAIAKTQRLKMIAVMTFFLSFPMFFYTTSHGVAAGVLGVVLLFGLINPTRHSRESGNPVKPDPCLRRGDIGRIYQTAFKVAAYALVVLAEIKLALIGFTAYWQFQGRSYREVGSELRRWIKPGGPVAISQSAWLGLREVIPADDLHLLVYSGPSSLENMPMAAKQPDADDYFVYLVLDRNILGTLKKVYPWLKRGIETGKFHVEKEIAPPFKPLPWAPHATYDLIVYKRMAGFWTRSH